MVGRPPERDPARTQPGRSASPRPPSPVLQASRPLRGPVDLARRGWGLVACERPVLGRRLLRPSVGAGQRECTMDVLEIDAARLVPALPVLAAAVDSRGRFLAVSGTYARLFGSTRPGPRATGQRCARAPNSSRSSNRSSRELSPEKCSRSRPTCPSTTLATVTSSSRICPARRRGSGERVPRDRARRPRDGGGTRSRRPTRTRTSSDARRPAGDGGQPRPVVRSSVGE